MSDLVNIEMDLVFLLFCANDTENHCNTRPWKLMDPFILPLFAISLSILVLFCQKNMDFWGKCRYFWLLSDILQSRSPENRKMVERWQKKKYQKQGRPKILTTLAHNGTQQTKWFQIPAAKKSKACEEQVKLIRMGQTREVTSCLGLDLLLTAPWWWAELVLKSSVSPKYVTSSKLQYLYIIIYCTVVWGTQSMGINQVFRKFNPVRKMCSTKV